MDYPTVIHRAITWDESRETRVNVKTVKSKVNQRVD